MKMSKFLCAVLALTTSAILWAAEAVNINKADAETLAAQITGVGTARATAIVQYRDKHGPFESVDDLALVRGIGASTIEKNRKNLSVSD